MACVGKTKKCNTVPKQHFGPIPGVEVGTTWMFRVQVIRENKIYFAYIFKVS